MTKVYIFTVTHRESGKQYVGSSEKYPIGRMKYFFSAGARRPIVKAIKEYGLAAFDYKVIEECDEVDRYARVGFYITKLGTISPRGYNLRIDE